MNLMVSEPRMTPYYLLLLPPQKFESSLSRIVHNLDSFRRIECQDVEGEPAWRFLSKKFRERQIWNIFKNAFAGMATQILKKEAGKNPQPLLQACGKVLESEEQLIADLTIQGFAAHLLWLGNHERRREIERQPTREQPQEFLQEYQEMLRKVNHSHKKTAADFLLNSSELYRVLHYGLKPEKSKTLPKFLSNELFIPNASALICQLPVEEGPQIFFDYIQSLSRASEQVHSATGSYLKILEFKKITRAILHNSGADLCKAAGYKEVMRSLEC